jgi:hypothetical protein
MVDREAVSIDIVEAKAWRTRALEYASKREQESLPLHIQAIMSWLKLEDSLQEDEMDQQLDCCHPATCNWIVHNAKINAWMKQDDHQKVVWLKGKPGSGITAHLGYFGLDH